ncbi:MAG TPA: hypothetical protein VNF47_03295 [Streptosporangiaceae bacterium]|nr:hypothetical protein [Streptosporangiaceae bacterium]
MSAGWVAGSVRARALARRRIGAEGARRLAACGSLADALGMLAHTPYRIGESRAGRPEGAPGAAGAPDTAGARGDAGPLGAGGGPQRLLAAAQQAIAAALLWDLRVLAGWLPQGGAQLMRALAGWFEIANVAERLAELSGRPAGDTFSLGALATAWPQARRSASIEDLRAALAASAWKDPGAQSAAGLELGMRARWAERVAVLGGPTRNWAASAVAVLLAGECLRTGQAPAPVPRQVARTLLGPRAAEAGTLGELASRLPERLAWVLDPVAGPGDLWRAEAAWWARVEKDGHALLTGSGLDKGPVLGAVAVLAADARRARAALEIAARGGARIEVFDAVA